MGRVGPMTDESRRPAPEGWFPGPDESVADLLRDRRFYTDGAVPPVLFVSANAIWGLGIAAILAAAWAIGLALWRLVRRERVTHAIGGLFGLGIALAIALRTGDASNYFVPGVISGGLIGVAGLVSIALGRPLSALLFKAVEGKPAEWYRQVRVRRTHVMITAVWTLVFLGRAGLRAYLIAEDRTAELAAQAVILGWPVTVGLVLASWAYLRWRLGGVPAPASEPAPDEPTA